MTNFLKGTALVIAGIVVGVIAHATILSSTPKSGGVYNTTIDHYPAGLGLGDRVSFNKSGTIGPGVNQSSYCNNVGQPLFISAGDVSMGWTSGTASSSLLFYVSTSTGTTVTDYARSPGSYDLIDGAALATSTVANASLITGTTTSAGKGGVLLQQSECLVFNVQERYACKANGACETATSTNRGIQSFFWNFKATYPDLY